MIARQERLSKSTLWSFYLLLYIRGFTSNKNKPWQSWLWALWSKACSSRRLKNQQWQFLTLLRLWLFQLYRWAFYFFHCSNRFVVEVGEALASNGEEAPSEGRIRCAVARNLNSIIAHSAHPSLWCKWSHQSVLIFGCRCPCSSKEMYFSESIYIGWDEIYTLRR